MLHLQAPMFSQMLQISCLKCLARVQEISRRSFFSQFILVQRQKGQERSLENRGAFRETLQDVWKDRENTGVLKKKKKKITDYCDAVGGQERQRQVLQRKQKQRKLLFSMLISYEALTALTVGNRYDEPGLKEKNLQKQVSFY